LREVCDLGDVDDKIPLSELRQSFIAMVEGRIEYLKDVIKSFKWKNFASRADIEIVLENEISRLESELLKLKDN